MFALALQPILASSCSSSDNVLTPSYLDDAIVLGPKDEAVKCYKLLKSNMHGIGLELKDEMCEAFSYMGISDWDLPVPIKSDGVTILGTPIGHLSFVENSCRVQVNQVKLFLSQLPKINDLQKASIVLRYCGVPKISHLLRSVPPRVIDEAAKDFDHALLDILENIVGCKFSAQERTQLTLGIRQGGFVLTQSGAFLGGLGKHPSSLAPKSDYAG